VRHVSVAMMAMVAVVSLFGDASAEDITHCSVGGEAWRAGDVQTAIDNFTICIDQGDLTPATLSTALSSRGNILVAIGAPNHALEDLERALELDPTNVFALYGRGSARFDLGDLAGALSDYTMAIDFQPDLLPLVFARANTFSALGRHTEAIADYDRVVAGQPGDPVVLTNRGWS